MKRMFSLSIAFILALAGVLPVFADNLFSCSDVSEIPQIECEALVDLYASTNGPEWRINDNWLISNTPSNWWGVTVTSGRVTRLDLDQNFLQGSLSALLGNLAYLTELNLSGNLLNGNIKPVLGNLTNLEILRLGYNHLSGVIPPELGNLTNLLELQLSENWLSGSIPSELGNLTHLVELYLYENELSGSIPSSLGAMSSLSVFFGHSNHLTGSIPPELGNLVNLTILSLNDNELSGNIPPELGNLSNLSGLGLWMNQLTGSLPPELGNLSNLSVLYLWRNQLSGNLPPELGNLTNLNYLYLSDNLFSGSIPLEIGNLSALIMLDLSGNQFSGNIPAELGNISTLYTLDIQDNPNLTGALPSNLTNLNLFGFRFGNTELCEPDDPVFQTWLDSIRILSRTGVLCSEYCCSHTNDVPQTECEALVALFKNTGGYDWISNTNWIMTSTISAWYGVTISSNHVTEIDLAGNHMLGSILAEIGNLTGLKDLYLGENQIRGTIPPEAGNMIALEIIRLNGNLLQSDVPETFFNLINLLDPGMAWDGGDGLDLDDNYLNVPAGYPDPANPFHTFLNQKDPDWHLRQSIMRKFYLPVVLQD